MPITFTLPDDTCSRCYGEGVVYAVGAVVPCAKCNGGEVVTIECDDVERWCAERDRMSNHRASALCRQALALARAGGA
jgi:hypothetical protein